MMSIYKMTHICKLQGAKWCGKKFYFINWTFLAIFRVHPCIKMLTFCHVKGSVVDQQKDVSFFYRVTHFQLSDFVWQLSLDVHNFLINIKWFYNHNMMTFDILNIIYQYYSFEFLAPLLWKINEIVNWLCVVTKIAYFCY